MGGGIDPGLWFLFKAWLLRCPLFSRIPCLMRGNSDVSIFQMCADLFMKVWRDAGRVRACLSLPLKWGSLWKYLLLRLSFVFSLRDSICLFSPEGRYSGCTYVSTVNCYVTLGSLNCDSVLQNVAGCGWVKVRWFVDTAGVTCGVCFLSQTHSRSALSHSLHKEVVLNLQWCCFEFV